MRLVVEGSRDLQKAYYTVGCGGAASGWFILFIASAAAGCMLQLSGMSVECRFRQDASVSY